MNEKDRTTEEIQRGEILRYLNIAFPSSATPRLLLYHLRDARYPCTYNGLKFHLEYLRAKGWVELIYREPDEIGAEKIIDAVRITAAGIDLHDRRAVGELGVKW
jgi:hypothetical protein